MGIIDKKVKDYGDDMSETIEEIKVKAAKIVKDLIVSIVVEPEHIEEQQQ